MASVLDGLDGKNLSTQLFLGSYYLMAGKSEMARVSWEKALKLDSDNESATLYLAAYHADRNPDKSLDFWKKSREREGAGILPFR